MPDRQRKASLGLVVACSLLQWWSSSLRSAVFVLIPLLIPLALIWFADEAGEFLGTAMRSEAGRSSYAMLVRWIGWAFLILPGIAIVAGGGVF